MKRIQAACLEQTLCFKLKDETVPPQEALAANRAEYASYRAQLERSHVACVIDEVKELPEGTVQVRIRRQYLTHPVGGYLA